MKIKRFYESASEDISPERTEEIIKMITSIVKELSYNSEELEKLSKELDNYKSDSIESNDQIDDSVININSCKTKIEEATSTLDSVVANLKDYSESGRKFLY